MALPSDLRRCVEAALAEHVRRSKGFEQESMINPLEAHNMVAAFAMSRLLSAKNLFDYCISVAPEGHVYGFFFELANSKVLSVHVDYPPRECKVLDDLTSIAGQRVLILEDDVASGTTLRLVTTELVRHSPRSMDLYLGRAKRDQSLENVDPRITNVYVSEDHLDQSLVPQFEAEFEEYFGKLFQERSSDMVTGST